MELVSWVAGEAWSDRPQCACPVIGTLIRAWNDALPEDKRTALLLPLVPKIVGTRADADVERRRVFLAADWLVRVNAPAWLSLAGLKSDADLLTSFTEISSVAGVLVWQPQLAAIARNARAACMGAWEAEWTAGRDAPRDATWFADWETTWAGPYAVCQAFIWHPQWEAARETAQHAAGFAFWGPAKNSIHLPTPELEQSTLSLIDRMIAVQPI